MIESEFWQLVETQDPLAPPESVAAELKAKLSPLDNQALAAFDKYFNQRMRLAYTWDLWGAAFVIAGCDTEYAFAEFRSWLISRGRTIFERALKQPDDLAEYNVMPSVNSLPYPYLDDYDLIAGMLFEERTGEELAFIPSGQHQPQGKQFKDKARLLKTHYPKLFTKYWCTSSK